MLFKINLFVVALLICVLFSKVEAVDSDSTSYGSANFSIKNIAANVYAVLRNDPPGLMCDGNSAFIITSEYVVVIDAPEASQFIISELKKITDKPVKYVINTHWHDDHIAGNKIYKDPYPDVKFIAHASTREYLPVQGLANRKSMIESAPGGVEYIQGLLEANTGPDGYAITEEERQAFMSDIALVNHYLNFVPQVEIILPDITFEKNLTIHTPDKEIQLLKIGDGHTAGDIVVFLPKEKIVISGDLIVSPIPLIGVGQSHVLDWSAALVNLKLLNPQIIIPGHGGIMTNTVYVDKLISLFTSIKEQTKLAVMKGMTLEQAKESVDLEIYRKEFAGNSKLKNFLFSMYVKGPGITSAYNELKQK